jgi:hypothetical protein
MQAESPRNFYAFIYSVDETTIPPDAAAVWDREKIGSRISR